MKTLSKIYFRFFILIFFPFLGGEINAQNNQWSQFRGHLANGISENADLPENWDIKTNKNIKWKMDVPGLGLSCPIIWDDNLFITTAISKEDKSGFKTGYFGSVESVSDTSAHEWTVYCLNKNTGAIKWEHSPHQGIPMVKRHSKSSHANCTPATDGKYIVVFFGSEGLYCYDFDGNVVWEKSFGKLKSTWFYNEESEWEFSSSPIIHDGVVIIQCDVFENSFIAAYDITNGNQLWKKDRDEYPGWCTPNIYEADGKTRIAVNGYKHRGAYDFKTGEEVWKMSGGGDIQVPTPIFSDDLIYFNSAHGKYSPVLAIKKEAVGDLTLKENETSNEYVQWSWPRGGAYMNTMLIYEGNLYNFRWNGLLYCIDTQTGEEKYKQKIGDRVSFINSPIAADGKIYVVDENGMVYTIKSGDTYELLQTNTLDDVFMTTPAISENTIFFRTMNHLIAISKE